MKKYEMSTEDADKIRALANLDRDRFAEIISSALTSMGMSRAQVAAISANSEALRAMIARASDSDIKKLAARLGSEKTNELLGLSPDGTNESKPT